MLILLCLVLAWGVMGAVRQAGTDARTGARTVRDHVRRRASVRAARIRRRGWRSPARWALAAGMGAYRTGVYARAGFRGVRATGRSLHTGWVAGAQQGREKHAAYVARREARRTEPATRTEPPVLTARTDPPVRRLPEARTETPVVVPHRTADSVPEDPDSENGAGEPTEKGTLAMSIASGGEALTYEQSQATLKEMHDAATELVSTVDMLQASLVSADLDPQTLGEVAEILDAATGTQAAAQKALQGLESRHAHLHEAISTAPHVAQTDFYRN